MYCITELFIIYYKSTEIVNKNSNNNNKQWLWIPGHRAIGGNEATD